MRIPIITTDISYPAIRPGDVSSGFRAQAEMGMEVVQTVSNLSELWRRHNELIEKTEAANIITRAQKQVTDLGIKLEKEGNYANYYPLWQTEFNKIKQESLTLSKNKNVQSSVSGFFLDFEPKEYGKAKEKHFKLGQTHAAASLDVDLYEQAMQGADGKRLGLEFILNYSKSAGLNEKEMIDLAQKFLEDAEEVQVAKDGDVDPIKTSEKLEKGEYPDLDPKRQTDLAVKYRNLYETRERVKTAQLEKQEKQSEKAAKDFSGIMTADLIERIRTGEDVSEIVFSYAPHNQRLLISDDYEKLVKLLDAKKTGVEDDPDSELARDVVIQSSLSIPTITEGQVNNLIRSGKLGIKTGEKALDQIRTTNKYWREEGQQDYMRKYSAAKEEIRMGLGMSGMEFVLEERIDPVQKRILADITKRLNDRTIMVKDISKREDPIQVARELLPEYSRGLVNENLLSIDNYKKMIRFGSMTNINNTNYQDIIQNAKEQATTAYGEKGIKRDDYLQQLKYLKELERKFELNQTIGVTNEPESKKKWGR